MSIEINDFIRIYRNPYNETGLSALEGTDIDAPDDMPWHFVEIHVFRDGVAASYFLEGMRSVGLGNSMAVTRETGTTEANRVVVIARFDKPRPAANTPLECLHVIEHEPDHEPDHRARVESGKRDVEAFQVEREFRQQKATQHGEPIAALLQSADWDVTINPYAGLTSVTARRPIANRFEVSDGRAYTVVIPHQGEKSATAQPSVLLFGEVDMVGRYHEIAESHRMTLDVDEGEFLWDGPLESPADCAQAIETMEACVKACFEAKHDAYEEIFRAGMKVTAARRRLFAAGRDNGVQSFVNRGSQKARAGGEEIGPSEIAALVRMGWLVHDGQRLIVTQDALEAAGLPPRTESDEAGQEEQPAPGMR